MTELFLSFLPFTSLARQHSNQLEYIQKSLEYTMIGSKVSNLAEKLSSLSSLRLMLTMTFLTPSQ